MKIQLRQLQKNDKNFFLLDVEQVGQFRQAYLSLNSTYTRVSIDVKMWTRGPTVFSVAGSNPGWGVLMRSSELFKLARTLSHKKSLCD